MKTKKLIALLCATVMAASVLTACGSNQGTETTTEPVNEEVKVNEEAPQETVDLAGTEITFLNSKGEIQEALEEMAVSFEEETGIKVDVLSCGTGESPYTKVTSSYNSGSAPTMAMLDPTDVVALAEEYALDLSEESWVTECKDQILDFGGTVYSFPFCVEGRGLIYSKVAIEDTLGREFDPTSINSYDALEALLKELRDAGMENPVVISKEDWSLGAHQLGFIYDTYDGTTAGSAKLIEELKAGNIKPADYERFDQFINTMDLLLSYNINGKDPLGALYEQDPIFVVDGEAAIWANGCWAWPNLAEAGASKTDEYGFIPFVFGNDTSDFANNGIQAAATKHVMIDKVQATEKEIAAAKEFLNWIVYAETGQKMLVETVAVIPACKNNMFDPLDPLGLDIKNKILSGNTYSSSFVAPADHWSVLGGAMQKYIAKQSSKEELAAAIEKYWTSQE